MELLGITITLLLFVTLVSYVDLKYLTISNTLTLPFCIFGIVINSFMGGVNGLVFSLLGLLTGLFLILVPFLWGWVGGGDVKFLAAAGALVGPKIIVYSTLWGLILFGVVASVYLIKKGKFKLFLHQLLSFFLLQQSLAKITFIEVSGKLPLGLFLGIGIMLNWLYFSVYPLLG